MKFFQVLPAMLLVSILFSCQKHSEPLPGEATPLLVGQILRMRSHDQVNTFTKSYQYNSQGQLTMISDVEQERIVEQIFYGSGGHVDSIVYPGQGVISRKVDLNPFSEGDDGNTLRWNQQMLNVSSGGVDSTVMTYHWSGNQLLSFVTYIHNYQFQPLQDSAVYTYTATGNYLGMQDFPLFGSLESFATAQAWDTARNIFHDMPRLTFVLIGGGPPITTRGEHNVTQVLLPTGETNHYLYTYNDQGYPLTIRLQGEDFDEYTYVYDK